MRENQDDIDEKNASILVSDFTIRHIFFSLNAFSIRQAKWKRRRGIVGRRKAVIKLDRKVLTAQLSPTLQFPIIRRVKTEFLQRTTMCSFLPFSPFLCVGEVTAKLMIQDQRSLSCRDTKSSLLCTQGTADRGVQMKEKLFH